VRTLKTNAFFLSGINQSYSDALRARTYVLMEFWKRLADWYLRQSRKMPL